ncbi:hypothetical protein [Pontibacillus sp. ALD_SL1]|uniref:hypothetical protein n=1 Tax=Pontibacillus sp. ALD_SL1 TaxID=2777185 RepID=UPI001F6094A4|nr:hypothetical protein [Pontibacillus sp. ALD_SL1]
MRNNRKKGIFAGSLLCSLVMVLAACEDGTAQKSDPPRNDEEHTISVQNETDADTSGERQSEKALNEYSEVESPSEETDSERTKDMYAEKIENTRAETNALQPTDSSTYALKKTENDRW